MCGITGWVDFGRDLRGQRAAIEAMTATMICRGPDAGAVWCSAHAAIGHRRLSVIDLPGGEQPMRAPGEDDVVLTFSGEIYNFTEAVQPGRHRDAWARRLPGALPGKARHVRAGRPGRGTHLRLLDA
jgi:asparagine synthase (glutamine-hydrolysing)